jgi:hypothetical protein
MGGNPFSLHLDNKLAVVIPAILLESLFVPCNGRGNQSFTMG